MRLKSFVLAICFAAVGGRVGAQLDSPAVRYQALIEARGQQTEIERVRALFKLAWDIAIEENPPLGTFFGRSGYDHLWADLSPAAIARRRETPHAALRAIESIDTRQLPEVDRISAGLFRQQMRDEIAGQRFPEELLVVTQLGGVQQNAPQLLAFTPNRTVAEAENHLARLRSLPLYIDQTIALLEQGLARGITPPRITLRDVPGQVLNQITEDPLESPVLRGIASLPATMPEAARERLRTAAAGIYRDQVVPAWRKLHRFLVDRYLPGARTSVALTALPEGAAWYAHRVRVQTTTDLAPRRIHEIGLAEVARIRGEMERVKAASGFRGGMNEFFEFLRTDPQFFFRDKEELLKAYRDIAKRVDPELITLFRTLPRMPYGVNAVPAYAEKSQTTAYYYPGSVEAGRAGYVFANTYALETRPKWEMEALALHEGVPGHHLQLALAQEIEGLPDFRRNSWAYTGYVEGWGLYAESLGEELGLYRDPYAKFGQLTYEMWRAIRLVVDTGIHALGWTREQGIDYFRANAGKTENDIIVEVDRYIVWPGQALGYKLGELKIKELRAAAATELGTRFDIRAFHDEVLRHGAIPLDLLDANLRAWIARQR